MAARTRSPPRDESSLRESKKARRASKKYRLPLAQIHKYAEEGQNYLIPGAILAFTYRFRIGNPPMGKEERRYSIRFWQDKFRINDDKEVWNVNESKSASFLQSLKEHKLPDVLKGDEEDVEYVIELWRQGEEDNPASVSQDNPESEKQLVLNEWDDSSSSDDDELSPGLQENPDFTGTSVGHEGWDEKDDTDDDEED